MNLDDNSRALRKIKWIHTLIWIFFNAVFGYMIYEVITNQVSILFWVGVCLILLEGIVLVLNKWECPLTRIARKYSNSDKENFDIFLPIGIARHNKLIYSILFALIMVIYLIQKL